MHLRISVMIKCVRGCVPTHLSFCIFSASASTIGKRPMSSLKIILGSSGTPYVSSIVLNVSSQRGSTSAGITNPITASWSTHSSRTQDIAAASNGVKESIGEISIFALCIPISSDTFDDNVPTGESEDFKCIPGSTRCNVWIINIIFRFR